MKRVRRAATGWRSCARAALIAALASASLSACGGGQSGQATTPPGPPPRSPDIGSPTGQFAGRAPRGALIMIHGGGWTGANRAATFQAEAKTAVIFQRLGFLTVTVDYRGGADGLTDIEHAYDGVRRVYGKRLPVCAIGTSAGGTLALLLAAHRPSLRCVISLAGPTDLAKLGKQRHGHTAYELAVRAFGQKNLSRYSPVRYARHIRARVMLLYASNDPIVPPAQGNEFLSAHPGTRLLLLPSGSTTFVHSRVSTAAAHRAEFAEIAFLDSSTAKH